MILNAIVLSLTALPQGPRQESPQFHAPQRLKAGSEYVKVDAPGYASPSLHDLDGDGKKDLVVGGRRCGASADPRENSTPCPTTGTCRLWVSCNSRW
jgi:hypothetical protein